MSKIKSVLTAIGNPKLQKELKRSSLNVIANDIQYKEGILEYLNENIDIVYIIIEENIPGEISTKELIKKIKEKNNRIKIILITQQNDESVSVYKKIKQYNIFEIISAINQEDPYIRQHISKEMITMQKEGKIITILGANGIGKSIFTVTFAQALKENKVLIIDFDLINSNLFILLGIKNYSKKIKKIEENKAEKNKTKNNILEYNTTKTSENKNKLLKNTISTKYNIDLISGENLLSELMKYKNLELILDNIKELKEQYDYIIIDTSNNYLLDCIRQLVEISDKIIFISGANILEIKKAKELLNTYEEWGIEKRKINIVLNKCTRESVEDEIIKNIYRNYNVIGKINLSEKYDRAININNIRIKEIKNELIKIRKSIEEEKRRIYGIREPIKK